MSVAQPQAAVATEPGDLISEYVWLRDNKKSQEKKFDAWLAATYTARMEAIEQTLLAFLDGTKSDSIAAAGGTAYRTKAVSVTLSDPKEFQRHVIGDEAWDLLDWKANKTIVSGLVDAGEPLPPGVNYNAIYKVNVLRRS